MNNMIQLPVSKVVSSVQYLYQREKGEDMQTLQSMFLKVQYPFFVLTKNGEFWENECAHKLEDVDISRDELKEKMFASLKMQQEQIKEYLLQSNQNKLLEIVIMPFKDGVFAVLSNDIPFVPADGLSEQIRTPLSNIFALLPMLATKIDESSIPYLNNIYGNSYQLLRLSNNFETISRLEKKQYELESIDIVSLTQSIMDSVISTCKSQNIPISYTVPYNESIFVSINKQLYTQTLLNIVRNSLEYTRDGNSIQVSLSVHKNKVLLQVSDKGMGIKSEYVTNIFDTFYSVNPYGDESLKPGMGLGLTIAQKTIQAFGGVTTVQSQFGEFTKVNMSMPISTIEPTTLNSDPTEYLLNRFSPLYVQLEGFCQLPYLF